MNQNTGFQSRISGDHRRHSASPVRDPFGERSGVRATFCTRYSDRKSRRPADDGATSGPSQAKQGVSTQIIDAARSADQRDTHTEILEVFFPPPKTSAPAAGDPPLEALKRACPSRHEPAEDNIPGGSPTKSSQVARGSRSWNSGSRHEADPHTRSRHPASL